MIDASHRHNCHRVPCSIRLVYPFMRRLFAPIGVALAASTRGPSSSSSTSPATALSLLSLQPPHILRTPAETFHLLADYCRQEGVDAFDVYGDFNLQASSNSFLRRFERRVADELGMDDAVFMPSGVMAQSIALLIHSKDHEASSERNRPTTGDGDSTSKDLVSGRACFACHESSHLLLHEEHAYRELLGMEAVVLPSPPTKNPESVNDDKDEGSTDQFFGELPLDFATVQRELDRHFLEQQQLTEPSRRRFLSTLLLEVPHRELGGKTTPYDDIRAMKDYCQQHNLRFHCDGARIFEASAAYCHQDITLSQLLQPFDSVYVSFYKGLGGMSGAMLLGSTDFCRQARTWLRRFGGNLYTILPYAVSGWIGFHRHWLLPQRRDPNDYGDRSSKDGTSTELDAGSADPVPLSFVEKKDKMVEIVAALSSHRDVANDVTFDPMVPHINMVHGYLRWDPDTCQQALDAVEEKLGVRVLVRVRPVPVDGSTANLKRSASSRGYRSFFEWSIGEGNGRIPTPTIVEAWIELAKELLRQPPVDTVAKS